MNITDKLKVAKTLFTYTKMTPQQYKEFKKLAEELNLTVESVSKMSESSSEDSTFKPYYINQ